MAELSLPVTDVRGSFLAAMAEFQREGRGAAGDSSMIGHEIRHFGPRWGTAEGFAEYVEWLLLQRFEETPRREGFVASTTFWWVDGDEYLGRIVVRHRLTPNLLEAGGHIGYDVRPTARRRGHATAMLRAVLPASRAAAGSAGVGPRAG
ncbi:GNAT family N-acetyltransferase [Dactylosporangium sp. CA-233914]|uniref:GNAT family N-acetyltransferase n=1 Tax=Dactylosporangium sp. CA-233914 TaxID=3239934 RepID=UPI003D89E329